MLNSIFINEKYSTTRHLTKEKPEIINILDDDFAKESKPSETVIFLSESERRKGEGGLRTKGYFKQSYNKMPLITVITVVYNGAKHLEQTILSVIDQTYDNVEYIVIDGGSSDGTIDIVSRYEDAIDYWVSEIDDGIYDAMNKGLRLATGDYIAFLNADDWYEPDALASISEILQSEDNDYVFAKMKFHEQNSKNIHTDNPNLHTIKPLVMPFSHPTLFIKKEKMMTFDKKYRIASDFDSVCKLKKRGLIGIFLNKPIVNFREGGVSTSSHENELFAIRRKHYGLLWAIYGYFRFAKIPIFHFMVKVVVSAKKSLQKHTIFWER